VLSSCAAPAQVKFVSASEHVLTIFFLLVWRSPSAELLVNQQAIGNAGHTFVGSMTFMCRTNKIKSDGYAGNLLLVLPKFGALIALHQPNTACIHRTLGAFFHDINSRPRLRVCYPSNTIFQASLLEPLMEPEISEVI
jgi:hypothetical protein